MHDPDLIDIEILRLLAEDCSTSKAEIARSVGLTPTAVFERIRKLEGRGYITGYSARLDPEAFGKKLLSYVFVSEIKPVKGEKTHIRLGRLPEVEELHRVAGKDCYLVKIRSRDTDELSQILDLIGAIESVGEVQTAIVLETFIERPWEFLPDVGENA